jgi:N6-adenosine-specific RNA methylase IME4
MATEEIVAMRPEAAENSILLLWTTAPKLLEGLEVVEGWGFSYRTQLVWDKLKQGMGYWFRGQHEVLLLGVRGSPALPQVKIPSVFYGARGTHSKKPAGIKAWITKAWPDLRKVELFSREDWPGWEEQGLERGLFTPPLFPT